MAADLANLAHHLATGHDRVCTFPSFTIDHAQIAMANAAIVNVDLHLQWFQFAGVVFERFEFAFGLECCISFRAPLKIQFSRLDKARVKNLSEAYS